MRSGSLGALVVGAAFGWLTDVIAIRRVLARSDEHLWLLVTLALATMVQQAVGPVVGHRAEAFPAPDPAGFRRGPRATRSTGCRSRSPSLMAVALELFYRRTMYGKLFLAMSEEPSPRGRAAFRPTGSARCPTSSPARWAALAGFAAGQLTFAYFALGLTLTLNGFIALAVGGLGSNVGALVGGAALGLLNAVRHATSSAANSSRRSPSAC